MTRERDCQRDRKRRGVEKNRDSLRRVEIITCDGWSYVCRLVLRRINLENPWRSSAVAQEFCQETSIASARAAAYRKKKHARGTFAIFPRKQDSPRAERVSRQFLDKKLFITGRDRTYPMPIEVHGASFKLDFCFFFSFFVSFGTRCILS